MCLLVTNAMCDTVHGLSPIANVKAKHRMGNLKQKEKYELNTICIGYNSYRFRMVD